MHNIDTGQAQTESEETPSVYQRLEAWAASAVAESLKQHEPANQEFTQTVRQHLVLHQDSLDPFPENQTPEYAIGIPEDLEVGMNQAATVLDITFQTDVPGVGYAHIRFRMEEPERSAVMAFWDRSRLYQLLLKAHLLPIPYAKIRKHHANKAGANQPSVTQ